MGNGGISVRLSKLIFERKLMKTKITNDMVTSEIETAKTDLQDACDSLERKKS
jgi:hypothetical protein